MLLQHDVPLAPLTTLRLGGRAAQMATIVREADLLEALKQAEDASQDVFVLGGGSNVVVSDEGFSGLILRVALRGTEVFRHEGRVRLEVAAGEEWDTLVTRSVDEGWSGVECLAGIPGLVGATPIQNVGAYGQEVRDTLVSVRAFDRTARVFVDVDARDCAFGYRTSRFRGTSRYVIVRVTFDLEVCRDSGPIRYAELGRALGISEGQRAPCREVRDAALALRRSKGMVLDPDDPDSVSVGSFFVNPTLTPVELDALEERAARGGFLRDGELVPRFAAEGSLFKVPAGWLVERAGFGKGYGRGCVGVSAKHALALVHRGRGTTHELLELAREIQRGVRGSFGVELRPEPIFLGCTLDAGSVQGGVR
jgi:UDP-N-acetylmuramate dehydrogenase